MQFYQMALWIKMIMIPFLSLRLFLCKPPEPKEATNRLAKAYLGSQTCVSLRKTVFIHWVMRAMALEYTLDHRTLFPFPECFSWKIKTSKNPLSEACPLNIPQNFRQYLQPCPKVASLGSFLRMQLVTVKRMDLPVHVLIMP